MYKRGEIDKRGKNKDKEGRHRGVLSDLEDPMIAFEASGNYEYFYDLLESFGHRVIPAHPLKTKMIAEAKIKTELRRNLTSGSNFLF